MIRPTFHLLALHLWDSACIWSRRVVRVVAVAAVMVNAYHYAQGVGPWLAGSRDAVTVLHEIAAGVAVLVFFAARERRS